MEDPARTSDKEVSADCKELAQAPSLTTLVASALPKAVPATVVPVSKEEPPETLALLCLDSTMEPVLRFPTPTTVESADQLTREDLLEDLEAIPDSTLQLDTAPVSLDSSQVPLPWVPSSAISLESEADNLTSALLKVLILLLALPPAALTSLRLPLGTDLVSSTNSRIPETSEQLPQASLLPEPAKPATDLTGSRLLPLLLFVNRLLQEATRHNTPQEQHPLLPPSTDRSPLLDKPRLLTTDKSPLLTTDKPPLLTSDSSMRRPT